MTNLTELFPGVSGGNTGQYLSFREVTVTTDTLVLGDAGGMVDYDNAAAISVTLPPFSSVALQPDTRIDLNQYGVGLITVLPGAGVTLLGDPVSQGQFKAMSLWKRNYDEWIIWGGTTA